MKASTVAVIVVLLLVKLYQIGSAPMPAPASRVPAQAVVLDDARQQWAYDLATRLGNEQPSFETIAFLVAWTQAEDDSNGAFARNNPLNTTQTGFNETATINADGVKAYATYEDGMNATITTLINGRYNEIVAGIQTNDAQRALQGLYASPWGTDADDVASLFQQGVQTITPQAPIATNADARQHIIELAIQQVGKPYILGTKGPNTFDCSGLVQWSYAQIGIETTQTTYTQLDTLRPIEPNEVQPGDMIYFQYPWDQHTGILADVDNDGHWDMIHAASPGLGVIIDYNVFSEPFYTNAIIGYRSAL